MKRSINSSDILLIIALVIQLFLSITTNQFIYLNIFILGMLSYIYIYVIHPYLEKISEFKKAYKSRMRIINLEKKGDNLLIITFTMDKKENNGNEKKIKSLINDC